MDLTHAGDASLAAVIESLLVSVRRQMHVDVAYLAEYGPDHLTIRAAAADGSSLGIRVGGRIPSDASIGVACVTGALPPVLPDTATDRRARRLLAAADEPFGAFAAAPVRWADGTLFGALCVANRSPLPTLGAPTEQFLAAVSEVISDQLRRAASTREELLDERREIGALFEPGRLCTLLQPIVGLGDGRTVGVEALSRFAVQPHRSPDLWFALAGRHGLGVDLEIAAVDRALATLDRLPDGWYLSLNASPEMIATGRLAGVVPPSLLPRIVVEVTEHAAVRDYGSLEDALHWLRRFGARVAVDDVGAGFSSFRHVLQLRPDLLKVDRSLVRGLGHDPMHRAMVESIVRFAQQSGAAVVAEAVETPGEMLVLQDLGVPLAQGYLFAAPGDPEDLRAAYPVRCSLPGTVR